MCSATQLHCGVVEVLGHFAPARGKFFDRFADLAPQSLHEPEGAGDTFFRPLKVAVGRAVGKHEPARRIGTVLANDLLWVDGILFRLAHLLDSPGGNRTSIG